MGLERHAKSPIAKSLPHGVQRRDDGSGMMGVVVHQGHPAPGANFFHPAMNPRELGQALSNLWCRDANFETERRGSQGVQHVVFSRKRDKQFCDILAATENAHAVAGRRSTDVVGPPVGIGRPAERYHRRSRRLRGFTCGRIFGADKQQTIRANLRRKRCKRRHHFARIRKTIEVIGLDIQNGSELR